MQKFHLEKSGMLSSKVIYHNLSTAILTEMALERDEGVLSDTGALVIHTGKYTGRSPKDRFIVDTAEIHNKIAWNKVNVPISKEIFNIIKTKMFSYLHNRELFVFDGFAGADFQYRKKFRIINELACQNMFMHILLIRPTEKELNNFGVPDFTVVVAPKFQCQGVADGVHSEAAILINFEEKLILIMGTQYSGEIKKAVFSVMNFLMPQIGVLPMHCSANMNPVTKETAVFFGLSGTGKTTLSADPERILIGDDEHGWSSQGIFNFEGGCYAKCIHLTEENEPDIYRAIKFGTILENVVLDSKTRKPDYNDNVLTENTRACYPIEHITNIALSGVGGIPKALIFLTADSFGILPPISCLSKDAAMYHFITGFTSKIAGTEREITEPIPTFSTLFGEPFMPLSPDIYANMLGEYISQYNTHVYLVNTGWTGGPYGVGSRIQLSYTRAMITAALNDQLDKVVYKHDNLFNLDVPQKCPNVPEKIMNPRNTWNDVNDYDKMANKLAGMFQKNFNQKYPYMPVDIRNAGPHL